MEENNITVDKAVQTIKGAILRAQAQASQSSNAIQLSLYYGIGRYVSINLQQAHWGAKALDTISERLQRELPGLRGFSSGNLKKMRIFYEEWQCLSIGSPLANQLQQLENKIEEGVEIGEKTLLCINRPIESADLHIEDFVGISFTHHMEILHKTTTLDERIYYIHQVNLYHWNKYVLRKYLLDDLYHHQGNMPNNFPKAIPDIKQSMKTISMFKDEYLLDFINTENLGQLCTYLQALDLTVKKPHENPSIGIVLCKEMNKAFVDIVVRNYDSPMGVATYKTKQDMPEELQKALPDLDKMKDLFCKSL